MLACPILRKSAKWGGLTAAVLLLALWIATVWWGAVRMKQDWVLLIGTGRFELAYLPTGAPPPPQADRWMWFGPGCKRPSMGRFSWWFDFKYSPNYWSLYIPIWSCAALAALVAAVGWRLDAIARRRVRIGACPRCAYDLRASPVGSPCPECGHPHR